MRYALGVFVLAGACSASEAVPSPSSTKTSVSEQTAAPAEVSSAHQTHERRTLAVVVPRFEVDLVPLRFGRVSRVDVLVGTRVAKDAVVAKMDGAVADREYAQAQAQMRVAKAELDRSAVELHHATRSREALEKIGEFVPKDDLRERTRASKVQAAARRRAAAALAQAKQGVVQSGAQIQDGLIRAPFDGYISRRYVDSGATLSAGEGIVRIVSEARLIRFAIAGDERDALEVGATVQVDFDDAGSLRAVVSAIEPEVDPGTHMVLVEAILITGPETYADLSPGVRGQVRY